MLSLHQSVTHSLNHTLFIQPSFSDLLLYSCIIHPFYIYLSIQRRLLETDNYGSNLFFSKLISIISVNKSILFASNQSVPFINHQLYHHPLICWQCFQYSFIHLSSVFTFFIRLPPMNLLMFLSSIISQSSTMYPFVHPCNYSSIYKSILSFSHCSMSVLFHKSPVLSI